MMRRSVKNFRPLRFALVGGISFVVAEIILGIGLLFLTGGTMRIQSEQYLSTSLIVLNSTAAVLSVATGFFVNERVTVRDQGEQSKRNVRDVAFRLLKFEMVYGLGNVVSILTQLLLLRSFSISPLLGNIAGVALAYPVNYSISMTYVWKVRIF
jgi:putative flippase GtrA